MLSPDAWDLDEKIIDLGGTLRTLDAARSLERAKETFGAVGITRLANVTGLDSVGVAVWTAVRPLAKSLTVSQGKGLSHELAQISAAMEAIEIFHAEEHVPVGHRMSVIGAARSRSYVPIRELPIRTTAALAGDCQMDWVDALDVVSGRTRFVPREMVALDFTAPVPTCSLFVSSSNGLASGNTAGEALMHGLCEVIERDGVSFWHVERTLDPTSTPTRVKLASVDDPGCRVLIELCLEAGLSVCIWNSSRLGVPCFTCAVHDSRHATMFAHRSSGYGCHPLRKIALSRAITEALQSRLTHISGARDDIFWSRFEKDLPVDTVQNTRWVHNLEVEDAVCDYAQIPEAPASDDVAGFLDWLIAALFREGLEEVLTVDLTSPAIGIPVIKVIVPGLEFSAHAAYYTPGPRMQLLLDKL